MFFDHSMEAIVLAQTRGRWPIMKMRGTTGNLFAVSVGGMMVESRGFESRFHRVLTSMTGGQDGRAMGCRQKL